MRVVANTDADTLVADTTTPDAMVCYVGLSHHEAVRHMGEYVLGQAHTNGIEAFWSMLKRGYYGTYAQDEPEAFGPLRDPGRHNARPLDTITLTRLASGLDAMGV